MRNKRALYIFIAVNAVLIALVWWFFPRDNENVPPPAVEAPAAEIATPPPKAPTEAPKEIVDTPAEEPKEEEDPLPPPVNEDEIKALRQAAKSALSQFYSSQRAFHLEFNRYTTDLKAAGWSPNSGTMNYKLGFLSESTVPPSAETDRTMEDPRLMTTDEFDGEEYTNIERFAYSREAAGLTLQEFAAYCKRGCTADNETFEVLLILPLGDNRHVDIWVINEKKEIRQLRDGITGRAPEPPPES